ncbi:MAG: polysaccharide pyruvyl transferase CsaB [Phycisphaerae bacterium]|nr:polysaccharide pyruvyl transferase CsaB [Phycisphaerae bacterium]
MTSEAGSSERSTPSGEQSGERPSPRIMVHGFYGAGNLGDEAILAGIVKQLHGGLESVQVMVISQDPEETERLHPVRAIHRHDLHGQSAALSEADLLVFGGGGLCNDYWSIRPADVLDDAWGSLAYYLRLPVLARLQGVPVAVYAQGVGPLTGASARRMVRVVFDDAAQITVRDGDSARLVRELGVKVPVEVTADPAFSLTADDEEADGVLRASGVPVGERPVIGVSVRPFGSITEGRLNLLARSVGRFAADHDAHVLLLPFCVRGPSADVECCTAFASAMPEGVARTILDAPLTPRGMLGVVGRTDLMVGMRYHASVFAIHRHVPVVSVAYDPKVTSLLAETGSAGLTLLDLNSLEAEVVDGALARTWEHRESIREALAGGADEIERRVSRFADALCELAKDCHRRNRSAPGREVSALWTPKAGDRSTRGQLADTRGQLTEAQGQLRETRTSEAEAKKRAAEAERQFKQTQSSLESATKQLQATRTQAAELERRLNKTREDLNARAAANEELKKKLRFSNERARDIAEQLQQIWESPSWQFVNKLHHSRIVGGGWRLTKRLLPTRLKEYVKRVLRRSRGGGQVAPQAGGGVQGSSAGASGAGAEGRSTGQVMEDLREFLERVDKSDRGELVVFVTGVKFVQSEGQRVTQIVREFIREKVPVLLLYFRWQGEYHQAVPVSEEPLFFQLPLDLFEPNRKTVLEYPYRGTLNKTCVFEFPYPAAFQWVNEFNLAGWRTVYDIIDDWEEFHEAGKAVWYEEPVEQYLCANSDAVTAIVPLLAEKARGWAPDLDVAIVPNGVSPDSFDMSLPKQELERGEVTVGYFGYLAQAWFDWELVAEIAASRPTWRFHIIGYGEAVPVKLTENVQLLGKVSHHLLYGYTQNWDVAIVPFKPTTLSKGADPIKVYEYLTLGLPVVVTDIPHLRSYPGVYVAESVAEFNRLLGEAAEKGIPEEEVKAFLAKCTWYQRGLGLLEAARGGRRETALVGE